MQQRGCPSSDFASLSRLSQGESRINCISHAKGHRPAAPDGGLWLSILEKEEDGVSLLLGAVFLEQAQDAAAHDEGQHVETPFIRCLYTVWAALSEAPGASPAALSLLW